MPQKKRGRPKSDNAKSYRVDVRLTEEEFQALDDYCRKMGIKHPQGLRDGIKALTQK